MKKYKLILSSGIVNTFEWYDYALFSHFAPIIGTSFFPDSDTKIAVLRVFLVFAVGYLMRPIGGIFFGIIGDKYGRKVSLSTSVICMALPTAIIGLLPTYDHIGISATILMIIARMMQGLSMGGTLTGSVSFIIEHTERKKRGLIASITMSSICIGILLGSTVAHVMQSITSKEDFASWGWRLPFIIGIFILFAGIYIKGYIPETPLFEKAKKQGAIVKSPLKHVLQKHWIDMLISILINATGSVIFYLQAIYFITYIKVNRGFDDFNINMLANICYFIMAIITLLMGWISDFIGRRTILIVVNLFVICITYTTLIDSFQHGTFYSIVISQIILAILAASYLGPEPALQAEAFTTNIRNTALSLSYNLATSIFGGTTPYVVELLAQKTGNIASCNYYIMSCAITSIIALCLYKDRSK